MKYLYKGIKMQAWDFSGKILNSGFFATNTFSISCLRIVVFRIFRDFQDFSSFSNPMPV